MSDALETQVRLPIRVRRTIDGDGEMSAVLLVHCEARKRSVVLDECTECDDCESVHIDPLEEDSWVTCRRVGPFPAGPTVEEAAVPEGDRTAVASIMARRVVCVAPETSTALVRDLLLERGLTGAPVVNPDGTVVGFVSRADLLRSQPSDGSVSVAQIMTPLAVTVSETASIAEASAMMALEGVHRLPVVNNAMSGKVVGVVSALDVLGWFARRCGYLRHGMRSGN